MTDKYTVAEAARKAQRSAEALNFVNAIFITLALVGAAALVLIGLTEDDSGGGVFVIAGVAVLVSAVPSFALMRAVAAGTHLAGVMTLESLVEELSSVGGVRQAISDFGCETCGSRNVQETTCQRCRGEAVTLATVDGWYVTLDDPQRERYLDEGAWTQEFRDSIRRTVEGSDMTLPGWVEDPGDTNLDRFWDGHKWTSAVRDAWEGEK